ncbi:zf-TFIIB domain-containing protein [Paraburkholderia phymatum]|uniref:Transcription factor zinc-finger domain-containing protein n=1 Tax=Paraburkholderia phymatum (strain DSM 17167 / CIP 108236 / LMG 21445 / STM815) TaxID=391038 RepID=B2JP42_PARP8|nr:zf-TFIIB domain-containing protein [Paraburkholderia phymatum]ACC74595.1 conserved hypothetical protein [Paraburkholderia phymatum STM815]
MKCPVCKTPDLLMTERQGVEIDYCPNCRGVWLDRGELDKLLERMQDDAAPARHSRQHEHGHGHGHGHDARREQPWGRRRDSYDDDRRKHDDPRRRKKTLFDMFAFD